MTKIKRKNLTTFSHICMRLWITWLCLLCTETCTSSWLGRVYGPRRTADVWVTEDHPTRKTDLLAEQPVICIQQMQTQQTEQRQSHTIMNNVVSAQAMCLLLTVPIFIFSFEVTGVNSFGFRPTAVCILSTFLFVFLLFLLVTFLFLLLGWHPFLFLIFWAYLTAHTEDYMIKRLFK